MTDEEMGEKVSKGIMIPKWLLQIYKDIGMEKHVEIEELGDSFGDETKIDDPDNYTVIKVGVPLEEMVSFHMHLNKKRKELKNGNGRERLE